MDARRAQGGHPMELLRNRVACALGLLLLATSPAWAADGIHWTIISGSAVSFDWRGNETSIRFGTTTAYGQVVTAAPASPAPFSSAGPYYEAKLTGLSPNTL